MKQFSLAITTYNRPDETIEAFHTVIGHESIQEIIIQDDHSDPESAFKLRNNILNLGFKYAGELMNSVNYELKITKDRTLFLTYTFNAKNFGMSRNKCLAVTACSNDFVILFDSDNQLTYEYLNAISGVWLHKRAIYMPSFARPNFDYRKYTGFLDLYTIQQNEQDPMMKCLMNTCNYVVPRQAYINLYDYNASAYECDTLWFNYRWLMNGFNFNVVHNMEYEHKVHDGSAWLQNADRNEEKAKEIWKKILAL